MATAQLSRRMAMNQATEYERILPDDVAIDMELLAALENGAAK